jgi:hypothetical protein
MTKKKPRYESRVFDGRIIHSAEIERIHKEVLDFERIEAISEPMRELIEDLWPELANKLQYSSAWRSRQLLLTDRFVLHANQVANTPPGQVEERRCSKELSPVGQCEGFGAH